jgi:hypothetical protein
MTLANMERSDDRLIAITSSLERQQWLEAAVEALRGRFAAAGYAIPQKVRVAIGWPKRAASCGAIGECWATEASSDQHAELFISPQLTEGARIVDVLAHELVHATVGTAAGHGKLFKRCALAVGLQGPMRSTTAGPGVRGLDGYAVAEDRALSGGLPHRHAQAGHAPAAVPVYDVRLSRAGVPPMARSGWSADLSDRSDCNGDGRDCQAHSSGGLMLDRGPPSAAARRPSFGRPLAVRGLDQFDTPPIALMPLFDHEPLLSGMMTVCEPFCGKGNLVTPMRERGLTVFASDIVDRGCPDSTVLDFFAMTARPPGCDVLISNPAYARAMDAIEHALALGFRVIALLLKLSFLSSADRFERLHKPGHLRRVHVLAERLQDMHDAKYLEAGGKKAGQSQQHAWFVLDRDYRGPTTIVPVSIKHPALRMPWASPPLLFPGRPRSDHVNRYQRGTSRGYVLARLARDGRADLAAPVESGVLSVRAALRALRCADA